MNARFALAALAAACLSTVAVAQMGPGMGHGMMGGQGMGPGMMGGQGMGPGMMGGQGMGPGMMGGQGCGMGQAMGGGKAMGPGMRGGHSMGSGMMGGLRPADLEALNLGEEQRAKVTEIRRDLQRKRHALMGTVHELRWQSEDAAKSADFDEAAARKRFEAGAAVRKQMFEARLEAHKRLQAVLTPEQREQLRKAPGGGRSGPPAHL